MRWLPKRRDASSCLGALVRFSLFFSQHGPGGQHSASQQAMESGVRRASDDDVTPRTANNTGKDGRAGQPRHDTGRFPYLVWWTRVTAGRRSSQPAMVAARARSPTNGARLLLLRVFLRKARGMQSRVRRVCPRFKCFSEASLPCSQAGRGEIPI